MQGKVWSIRGADGILRSPGKTKGLTCDADSRREFELREGEECTKMQVEVGKAASRA